MMSVSTIGQWNRKWGSGEGCAMHTPAMRCSQPGDITLTNESRNAKLQKATEEHARLKKLWEAAQPLSEHCKTTTDQIVALEICNWNLEESILALCGAIGAKEPAKPGIGHMVSMTEDRWRKVWAYYLALRNWLPHHGKSGYATLLRLCDPDREIENRVVNLLGNRNELKELYVLRFCYCLEFWLDGCPGGETPTITAQAAEVEKKIKTIDPEGKILGAFQLEGVGKLELCHHKVFRRYDIILSSIGCGTWRGAMPMRGTDGLDRAATLGKLLSPIEAWTNSNKIKEGEDGEFLGKSYSLLGQPDDTKLFMASLLSSLLRSQELSAKKLAESRIKK